MARKSPRFVDDFITEYFGETPGTFSANLPNLMKRAIEFQTCLEKDLKFAHILLKSSDSQEARRIFIRAVPPYVEGCLTTLHVTPYLYPPLLNRLPEDCGPEFLEAMINFQIKTTPKERIKKTLIGIGSVAGVEISNEVMGEHGGQSLLATFRLRDSLMHPCSVSGFSVSDENKADAYDGVDWFKTKFGSVWSSLRETFIAVEATKHRLEGS